MKAFALLFALALSGCATDRVEGIPKFGAFTERPRNGMVTVQVIFWLTDKDVREECARVNKASYGIAVEAPSCVFTPPGTTHRVLYVRLPRTWDDHVPIFHLGHEVLHELHAKHTTPAGIPQ